MNCAAPTLSPTQLATLRAIIGARSGLVFPDAKRYLLESRLAERLAVLGFDTFDQYVSLLEHEHAASQLAPSDADVSTHVPTHLPTHVPTGELAELFNLVTINETSFFRDPVQLEWFESTALPRLILARRDTRHLRLWSAACSTGEEAYTIAMIVRRALGPRVSQWNIEILGTDLSGRALAIADAGRYSELAIRGIDATTRDRCFRAAGPAHAIAPELRAMVRFAPHNLTLAPASAIAGPWDAIFCRNAMIYFDAATRLRVLGTLHDHLVEGGLFLVGQNETVDAAPFAPDGPPDAHCYRRSGSMAREA